MIQLNGIQLTSQTTNHVQFTKILPASEKVELLTASAKIDF